MTENRLTVPINPALALRDLNRRPAVAPPDPDNEELQHNEELQIQSSTAPTNTTILQSDKPTNQQSDIPTNPTTNKPTNKPRNVPTDQQTTRPSDKLADRPAETKPRVDGRTNRPRQETADRTMVTSMRLAVSTLEALDEHCYRHRQRKQDIVQAALDMYFAATEEEA